MTLISKHACELRPLTPAAGVVTQMIKALIQKRVDKYTNPLKTDNRKKSLLWQNKNIAIGGFVMARNMKKQAIYKKYRHDGDGE